MKNKKVKIGLILFTLGLLGILSLLTMDMPLPPEAEAILASRFTPFQIKLVLLVNPILMLIIFVTLGATLHQKVMLKAPIIENIVGIKQDQVLFGDLINSGMTGGLLSGVLIVTLGYVFTPMLPEEFLLLGESLKPTLAARFLYGGITEEILMRFGLMTLVVWITSKIFKNLQPIVYWIGIIIAALLFALGHFPIAFSAVESPSNLLLIYVLLGNTIGGVIFGWLYWKKGLESAFIAHIFAHITMVLAEPLIS